MMPALPVLLALPWLLVPLLVAWRWRASRTLDEVRVALPEPAPRLSVIVPARDEARNIGRCVRSVLASTYPRLELVVVDDASSDGTADVARAAAAGDGRLRVVTNAPLPAGWFGKQWACATGARVASGELLLFTDADTAHGPELHARAVQLLLDERADLVTVGGTQEMVTVWERLVQPQVFQIIAARYGSTEQVNRSPRAADKIANGQFILVRRDAYDALDGHAAVRATVAEDLALGQRWFAAGRRTVLVLGEAHLRTRMYASLGELVRGWQKNVFAGGRDAVRWGALGRLLYPVLLPVPALFTLLPPLVLVAGLAGLVEPSAVVWSAAATSFQLLTWAVGYRVLGHSPLDALGYPIGAAILLYIVVTATLRGRRVAWKGRAYRHE